MKAMRVAEGLALPGSKGFIYWAQPNIELIVEATYVGHGYRNVGDVAVVGLHVRRNGGGRISSTVLRDLHVGRMNAALQTDQFRSVCSEATVPLGDQDFELGAHELSKATVVEWSAELPALFRVATRRDAVCYDDFVEYFRQREAQEVGVAQRLAEELHLPTSTIHRWVREGSGVRRGHQRKPWTSIS